MFGLFKKPVSVVAIAQMAMTSATHMPSEVQERLEPFNFQVDELFVAEVFALSYAVAFLGIERSGFGRNDASRICTEFADMYSSFVARQMAKGTSHNVSEATQLLSEFFHDRYQEYKSSANEKAIAGIFLQKLGQTEVHPTTRIVVASLVFTGLQLVTENMTKLSKGFKLR